MLYEYIFLNYKELHKIEATRKLYILKSNRVKQTIRYKSVHYVYTVHTSYVNMFIYSHLIKDKKLGIMSVISKFNCNKHLCACICSKTINQHTSVAFSSFFISIA